MQWWCAASGAAWEWRWTAYPGVWLFVVLMAAAYGVLVKAARSREERTGRGRVSSYASGLFLLWAALDWPVGALGAGYLASVHMVQFLVIALVAPPLLLLGIPEGAYRRLAGRGVGAAALRFVTHPLVALALFTVVMAATHWPPIVDRLMTNQLGSFVLDLVWLGAGVVFWWPVVAPVPERAWLTYPAKMGHLVAATMLDTGVFAYLAFSELPLYSVYELAPPVSLLSAREDQLVAGLLMKMGSAPVFWTAITILFFRWYRDADRQDTPLPATGTVESAEATRQE